MNQEPNYLSYLNRLKASMKQRRYRSKKKGSDPSCTIPKSTIQAFKMMTNKQLIELSRASLKEVEDRLDNYKRKTITEKN